MNFKLTHIHLLSRRLLIVYTVFIFCRLLFLIFNFHQFGDVTTGDILQSFFAGLVFDTAAVVYVFGAFILLHILPFNFRNSRPYQAFLKVYFVVMLFLCVLFNLVDTGYFQFSGKRSGIELFSMKGEIADLAVTYIVTYWYFALALLAMAYAAWRLYPGLKELQKIKTVKQFVYELAVMGLIAVACFTGARGGWWNLKPLSAFDAARLSDARLVHLTLNTPFQLIRTSQQAGLQERDYMDDAEAKRLFDPEHKAVSATVPGRNVVLIIIESLGKEYVGYHNPGKGFTPFIDSLMAHSVVYSHAYANGKRSIEGIPAIIASMPSVMPHDYISSQYQSNHLKGIGAYMQDDGYDASFYHGGKNGTMGFANFIAITSSGGYFGMNEYPDKEKDFDGSWGIYDEPYLQYFADELGKKKAPFFSAVFTLSSHHPYAIPASRASLFEEGFLPIHRSIRYADFSLKQFFAAAAQMPWYSNTVFVITSDHSASNHDPYYQSAQGRYEIPLFVFDPQQAKGAVNERTVQHADILPLILEEVKGNACFAFSSWGREEGFAVQYADDVYQLIQWPYVYRFDGEKGTGFYDLTHDPLMQQNIADNSSKRSDMDKLIKSYIQQYNGALIHNRTTIH